ncbi:LAQU0S20e01222g1_1 [Lachancea quebecensis]|uniref:LAQU0S20e01222g1_1 n=1 Tax=Lachancea quebecensis TaxID=1654605 RepID=A0A0P1KY39_9SACH|nr:LAQU0S20e01222g1_1 [Lachancea quebecensis]
MVPPKKSVKMDLNSFLNDESFGESWAEEEVDLEKINIPIQSGRPSALSPMEGFGGGGKGSRLDPSLAPERSERVQYDIPNHPPYRAVINNLPWDVMEDGIKAWFEDGLNRPGAVEDVAAPRDYNEPTRLKGFAFVTLCDRDALEASLKFNATKLNERMVYVSVAAPQRGGFRGGDRMGGFDDIDWSGARGSAFQGSRREEPDLDWGVARGSGFHPSADRGPRREEIDIDWSSARGSGFQESKPRREEPDLDWNAVRGSGFHPSADRKPRREEPDLDWGAVRGSNFAQRPSRTERKPRDEPELDWGGARGSRFGQRSNSRKTTQQKAAKSPVAAEDAPKIQKSAFDVLSTEDDEEQTTETESAPKTKQDDVAALEESTSKLTVKDDDEEWETVGKK